MDICFGRVHGDVILLFFFEFFDFFFILNLFSATTMKIILGLRILLIITEMQKILLSSKFYFLFLFNILGTICKDQSGSYLKFFNSKDFYSLVVN